jgi:hypothetical protein
MGAMMSGAGSQLAGAAIGAGFKAIGGILASGEAAKRRDAIERIANTPGLDFNSLLGESFQNLSTFAPQYKRFATTTATDQAGATAAGLETMMPGYRGSMEGSRAAYESMARGELPEEELTRLAQRGAERGVGYGMPGSEFTGRLSLRDLGIEGLKYRQAGLEGLGSLRREAAATTPQAPSFLQTFQGAMPGDVISQRATERANRIQMLLNAAGMPTGNDVWAGTLSDIGTAFAAAGKS